MPIWKGKGDIHDPGRYRGITLMSQALKFMERILDARVRHIVEDKGKVLEACVVPACIYGLGILALTERQEKMQIAENNWVRRIGKVTQEDRRKMKELREEIGMKKHLKMKVTGSRMRWAGHMQRMGEDRLSKGAWKAEGGGRRRGRPKLRWKDCVKRDLKRAGTNGQEWKTGKWRTLTMKVEEAIK